MAESFCHRGHHGSWSSLPEGQEGVHPRASGHRIPEAPAASHPPAADHAVWDNGPPHKSKLVRDFLAKNPHIEVHYLPGFSPELNP